METFILIGITGIGLGALYFLIASGLSLIYGLMGVLNFAHGSFLSVGAFAGFWVASRMGFETTLPEFLLAMIVGGLAAGLFALLIEQLLISRLYERHIDQALVTVGVALVVGAVLGGWFGNDLRMFPCWPKPDCRLSLSTAIRRNCLAGRSSASTLLAPCASRLACWWQTRLFRDSTFPCRHRCCSYLKRFGAA